MLFLRVAQLGDSRWAMRDMWPACLWRDRWILVLLELPVGWRTATCYCLSYLCILQSQPQKAL